jgi:GTP cyclohydrolase I
MNRIVEYYSKDKQVQERFDNANRSGITKIWYKKTLPALLIKHV